MSWQSGSLIPRSQMLSEKTVERLSEYRGQLCELQGRGVTNVFSATLAAETKVTAAQVRRDMMNLGLSGSTATGYSVNELLEHLGKLLDNPMSTKVALIGAGNLGRALLSYFKTRPGKTEISMAFDSDPRKNNRVYCGCRIYPMTMLEEMLMRECIRTAILSVPGSEADSVVKRLTAVGVRGILNFVPHRLKVPDNIFVHDMDINNIMGKVGYYAVKGTDALDRKQ